MGIEGQEKTRLQWFAMTLLLFRSSAVATASRANILGFLCRFPLFSGRGGFDDIGVAVSAAGAVI